MSFNTAPSAYPTPMLVYDPFQEPNGSWDSVPSFTLGTNGLPVSAALEIQSLGALLNPRLSEDQRDDLNVYPGMQIYNLSESVIQFYYGGTVNAWVTLAAIIGVGTPNDIVIFGPSLGTLADSHVPLLLNGGVDNNSNIFMGIDVGNSTVGALSTSNTAFGNDNLHSLTDGARNSAFGSEVLSILTIGNDNIGIGNNVLNATQLGLRNLGIGNRCMAGMNDATDNYDNVGAGYRVFEAATHLVQCVGIGNQVAQFALQLGECTFVGHGIASSAGGALLNTLSGFGTFALQSVQTGAARLNAFGYLGLQSATTAVRCDAFGYQALNKITVSATGSDSCAFGHQSFLLATTAIESCAFGSGAGASQLQYTGCSFLGYGADANVNNLTNATAIGAGATVSQSNSMILGAPGTQIGINTSAPVGNFYNGGSEGAKYTIVPSASFPYTAAADDNVIIGYPSGTVTITIPDSGPTNQGLTYKVVNLAGNGGDNIDMTTPSHQDFNSNGTLGPTFTKTFMAVFAPFPGKGTTYHWAVISGNDESP